MGGYTGRDPTHGGSDARLLCAERGEAQLGYSTLGYTALGYAIAADLFLAFIDDSGGAGGAGDRCPGGGPLMAVP